MERYAKKSYRLICLMIVLAVVFFLLSLYSHISFEDVLLREKVVEYERHLDIVTDRLDFNIESGASLAEQEGRLLATIATLDSHPMTFAELYRHDDSGEITGLSERTPSYEAVYFEPLDYPEFRQEVMDNFTDRDKTHTTPLWFEAEDVPGRTVYVSYRWTPKEYDGTSYLLVTGISKYTLAMKVPAYVYIVSTVHMAVTGILGLLFLKYINQIARAKTESFYSGRYGGKESGI